MANLRRWICPHCEHAGIIGAENTRTGIAACAIDAADGNWVAQVAYTVCPNPNCRLTTIYLTVGNGSYSPGTYFPNWFSSGERRQIRVRPATYARPIPDYVPAPIRQDYIEACGIIDLSPKAAATLARRALQGMIRDFHGVSKGTLAKEIDAIRDHVDPLVWQAIDSVRTIGNIGAHMEKDINQIVEVEPSEAERLVRLIELLVSEWYVGRFRRQQQLAEIIALGSEKQSLRSPTTEEAIVEGQAVSDDTAVGNTGETPA